MRKLKDWLTAATKPEIRELARMAGTSTAYLNQLKNEHRVASPEMAGRIAEAAEAIRGGSAERIRRLPSVSRGDLSCVCAGCPFFKNQCGGKK